MSTMSMLWDDLANNSDSFDMLDDQQQFLPKRQEIPILDFLEEDDHSSIAIGREGPDLLSPTSVRQELFHSAEGMMTSGPADGKLYCYPIVEEEEEEEGEAHNHQQTDESDSNVTENEEQNNPDRTQRHPRRKHSRSRSLDVDKDFMLFKRRCPIRARRWSSCPPIKLSNEERKLQIRRFLCESTVQQLYEDRKDHVVEIFRDTWLLTDPLQDYRL